MISGSVETILLIDYFFLRTNGQRTIQRKVD